MGLAELLGVKGKSIQWERPLLFFAALFISDLVWLVLAPSVSSSSETGVTLSLFHIPPAGSWLEFFLGSMVLAGLALAAFRLIPNTPAAIAVVAVAYGLWRLADRAFLLPRLMESRPITGDLWNLLWLTAPPIWICLFFAALALALRWVRPVWLALPLGAMAGGLVDSVLIGLLNYAIRKEVPSLGMELRFLPFTLLDGALFGGALWAGLWLSRDRPATPGTAEPRLRKGFYLGTLAAALGVPLLLYAAVIVLVLTQVWKSEKLLDLVPIFILWGMSSLLIVYGAAVMCAFIYRMWAAIQDGHARTSPGRALGFLFIPIYQFYWVFQAFPGFAKDFNAFAARHSLNVPRLSPGLFTAYAILCIVAMLPWLDVLLSPAIVIVGLVLVARVCDAVNAIPSTLPAAAPSAAA
ncbi:MAG: hypothetical protein ABSA70_14055 [Terriglobia bacterium]